MATEIFLSWDEHNVRYLVADAESRGGTLPLVFTASDNADEEEENAAAPTVDWRATMAKLRKHLAGTNAHRATLLLARSQLECLYLELPRATDAELPLLVRNQVFREAIASESDSIDYIAFDDAKSEQRRVLAVTATRSQMREWSVACAKGGFSLRWIAYRPEILAVAAADGAAAIPKDGDSDADTAQPTATLIVARCGDELDLGGVVAERLVALRTVKLPATVTDPESPQENGIDPLTAPIVAEVRRAVLVGLDGVAEPIGRVVFCGDVEAWSGVASELDSLDCVVTTTADAVAPDLWSLTAASRGAAVSWSALRSLPVNLLRPKEPPRPVQVARIALLAAVVMLILGGILFAINRSQLAAIQKQHDDLVADYDATAAAIAQVAPVYQVLNRTDFWEKANLSWLDELRAIVQCFPDESELTITRMTLAANTPRRQQPYTGVVTLTGMVRDPAVLRTLQAKVQATRHHLMPSPVPQPNPAGGGYPWLFTAAIYCYPVADKTVYTR